MASLNLTKPTTGGTLESLAAAGAAGDSFPLAGAIIVRAKNASGASRTITIVAQTACNHGVLHNGSVVIADGETREFSITDVGRFADSNGRVQLTYNANAGLTLAAYPMAR